MKNSYYFPHDYHARHDPKLERLRMEVGPVGDGIYWDLVEMLYEEDGYLPLKHIPLFAKALNTTTVMMEKIIKESELFCVNGNNFYSESLLERLRFINAKRRKARISGRFGGLANAKRTLSERVAIKESKVKESKVNNISEKTAALSKNTQNLLKQVHNKGFNIYQCLERFKKLYQKYPPEDCIIKVCELYIRQPDRIKKAWPWFITSMTQAMKDWYAARNQREAEELKEDPKPRQASTPKTIKEILDVIEKTKINE